MKRLIAIAYIILRGYTLQAEEVRFTASAPDVVALGEQFRITYSMNTKPASFRTPEFGDFVLLAGPSTSTSTSVQFINGQMSQSSSYAYTYIFQANKEGVFNLTPAEIIVDGSQYYSNPLRIEVIKGRNTAPPVQQQDASQKPDDIGDEDLFVRVLVDKRSVFQGEHIIATIKLYTKINLNNIDNPKFPSFDGFLKQDVKVPPISLQQENIDGQIYYTGVLQKELLFPQKTGEIVISTFELDCIYQKVSNRRPRSLFDEFFNNYENVRKTVKSNPVKITVKPLPNGKPESFKGAVGKLSMEADINKSEVNTNDAITLKVKIYGNGNIKLVDPLDIKFPADFESYEPKSTLNVNNTASGASGSKVFEYLLIPRYAGDFTIPSFTFSYFDPETKQYKQDVSQEFKIKVNKGADEATPTMVSGFSKEDVKFIGKDIRFIKQGKIKLRKRGEFLIGSSGLYLSYLLSTALFFTAFFLRRKKVKENADVMLTKNKKANKYARKRLNSAARYLKTNNREQFYDELLKAIWGYLSDKLAIPVAELSKNSAVNALQKKGIEQPLIDKFVEIIDNCEFARYAPAAVTEQMDVTYDETIKVISKLQQKIK